MWEWGAYVSRVARCRSLGYASGVQLLLSGFGALLANLIGRDALKQPPPDGSRDLFLQYVQGLLHRLHLQHEPRACNLKEPPIAPLLS